LFDFLFTGGHTGSPLQIISFLALLLNSRSLAQFSLSLFSFAVCLLLVAGCFCFSNRQSANCNQQCSFKSPLSPLYERWATTYFLYNPQSVTGNRQCIYFPLTFILSPQGRGNFFQSAISNQQSAR
jgi:hypothetical protein